MSEKIHVVCAHCDSVVGLPEDRLKDSPRCPSCHNPLFNGKPIELTAANFAKHVSREDLPLVIDFWAPWCGPCIAMAPYYEAAAAKLEPKLRFAKLNTQDEPGRAPAPSSIFAAFPPWWCFAAARKSPARPAPWIRPP
jgi:thioredoxin 2